MSSDIPESNPTAEAEDLQTVAPAMPGAMDEALLAELFAQQNFPLAVIAGLVVAVLGGLAWAAVTVATGYRIGWMAIGIGFLVGGAVRAAGKGMTKSFGIAGGILALFGCALGNLLAICGLLAQQAEAPIVSTTIAVFSNPVVAVELLKLSFSPMDLVFYSIAVYEGYKFSFRQVSEEELDSMLKRQSGES